ncbi:MAG: hypothetical protein NTW66_04145 [Candidatus Magasanikbacteria bacterium]|nr:hypothetical protein [Candidatus Magasanikbacteria bacterium]
MKVVNLTPHVVNLCDESGAVFASVPSSGQLARVKTLPKVVGQVEVAGRTMPVRVSEYGPLEGLPDPVDGVLYVVSLQTATAAAKLGRTDDILVPDDTVRDPAGIVIGCRAFGRQP